ncbi:MAG: cytochrome C biogenesis protein [Bdellovibrionales bacterium GWB1_55_8]|nr:MAG: cytochrome C biogenesis protein [Bdellovibrionales bacterium GWB1_55_8]
MNDLLAATASALWLGVLTSISPCPLATNIVAVSYLGKGAEHPRRVLWGGILYTSGRAIAYAGLGWIIARSLLSTPELSQALQLYMNKILGPLLILIGMFLLEFITLPFPSSWSSEKLQTRLHEMGLFGAAPLGFVLALSFCPVSAALFFGSLIPLTLHSSSTLLLPSIYGVGTGIPVLAFALLATAGVHVAARLFNRIGTVEIWLRRVTAIVFIGVGIYYSLNYVFEVFT